MAKKAGIGIRNRDIESEIRHKNNNTRVETLRKTYGDGFAPGYKGDEKLMTVLNNSGLKSLTEYLKRK